MKNKIIKKKNKDKKNISFFYDKNFSSLSRILLSSVVVISFFSIIPALINFTEKNFNTKEFTNNSKKILAYTLDNDETKNQNKIINEEDILFDPFGGSNSLGMVSEKLKRNWISSELNIDYIKGSIIRFHNETEATDHIKRMAEKG